MIHKNWENRDTIKTIKCVHADAKKFVVNNMLTPGQSYQVKNETDEFILLSIIQTELVVSRKTISLKQFNFQSTF